MQKKIFLIITLLLKQLAIGCMVPPNTCPAPITAGFLHVNCCDIYYELSGVPTNGTIVFLPDYWGNQLILGCQRNFFCANGYQFLVIDRRGQGSQGLPSFSPAQELSDINSVISVLGINNFILIGWSYGGGMAQLYAATYPQKVQKLILLDTAPKFLNDATWQFGATQAVLEEALVVSAVAKATNNMQPFGPFISSIVGVDVCEVIDPAVTAAATLQLSASLAIDDPQVQADAILQGPVSFDIRSQLQFITAPTLILYGCNDALTQPGASLYMAAHIAGSIIIGFAGHSHGMPILATDKCNQTMLQFIQGVPLVSDTSCTLTAACSNCGA